MKMSLALNKMRFVSCAHVIALLQTLVKRAAAGGKILHSDVCPVFEYFQNHQPRVSAQWPMNKMNLNHREIFRGKISLWKDQINQTDLEERTQSAPNQ
jgi:hypothetical protein